jgi:ABC-type nitrate/sulfonate/bicarbonate transport system substrate-binding protein
MKRFIYQRVGAAIVSLACLSLAVSACSQSGAASKNSAAKEQNLKISLLNPTQAADYLNLIADEKGYFKENGIKPEFVTATVAVTPLLSGDLDVAGIGAANGLVAVGKGQPLVFITAPFQNSTIALMVRKGSPLAAEAHKWPNALTELKGLTLGVTVAGAQIDLTARYLVRLAGMTPDTDVKVVAAGNASILVAGLQRGQFDAALVPSPQFEKLEAAGTAESILDIYKGEGPSGDLLKFPILASAVTKTFAAKHPDLVAAYQKSFQQAMDYARNPANTQDVINLLAKKMKVDPSTVTAGVTTFISCLKETSTFTQAQWDSSIAMMKANGILTKDYAYGDYVVAGS